MPRLSKLLAASVTTFVMIFAVGLLFVQPAHAGVLDATCTPPSSQTIEYDPPLTATPHPAVVTTTMLLDPCVSLSVPGLTSGVRMSVSPGNTSHSCAEILASGTPNLVITWNTGQTSTIAANRTTTIVGATLIVTHTGQVTAGLFAGDTAVVTLTGVATPILLCLAGLGTVSSVYTLATLEITSI